jgi:hypothetical protein
VLRASGLGIAIVNDFKSIEGDRKMGLQSLPVAFGVDTGQFANCTGRHDVCWWCDCKRLPVLFGGSLSHVVMRNRRHHQKLAM